MIRVAATKLRTTISDLLDRVVHHGERVAVERYGKPVAALVSPQDLELLEAIEDRMDIEAARKALREPGQRSWGEVKGRARSAGRPCGLTDVPRYTVYLKPAAERALKKIVDRTARRRIVRTQLETEAGSGV